TGGFELEHDLNRLPFIDRDLTRWRLYSQKNGNYKHLPGTYTMAGRDCWWHKCTFCSWTTLYPRFRVRSPESLLDEIGTLIERYRVREVFDDSGSFPAGEWLEKFCRGMIDRGYHRKVTMGCNMRFGSLDHDQYALMRQAGFRYVLFGVESSSQQTLDRINKGIKVSDIVEGCRMAKKAGLQPHLTVMVGYPWETKEDALATLALVKDLFRRGCADTLQATIVVPYPGTPLFRECQKDGSLRTEQWDDYDMRQAVMETPISEEDIKAFTRCLYKVFLSPKYILRRLTSVRSPNDLQFIWRGGEAVLGHLRDFSARQ
ncbi:MAG: radical SAM protein, partial [Chloroflexi bacterium]|nr:radical SAM protein [Chloroflexota bacterium]